MPYHELANCNFSNCFTWENIVGWLEDRYKGKFEALYHFLKKNVLQSTLLMTVYFRLVWVHREWLRLLHILPLIVKLCYDLWPCKYHIDKVVNQNTDSYDFVLVEDQWCVSQHEQPAVNSVSLFVLCKVTSCLAHPVTQIPASAIWIIYHRHTWLIYK